MNLDTPLLRISPRDHFTLRDAVQSVAVFGGIGSGKTSGTGKSLAGAYLKAGMGGLVLCAKPEEADLWRQYVATHDREESLLVFSDKRGSFNFIAYELARQSADGVNSVVECLMQVIEAGRIASGGGGKPSDNFWQDTARQLLRNTLPVLFAATKTITVPNIIQFVRTAPRTPDEMQDAKWQQGSIWLRVVLAAENVMPRPLWLQALSYWNGEYARLDPKTQSNIGISLTTALDRFNHGWLQRAFCEDTTLVPELCFHGAIILLDMPALKLNADGIVAQHIFKYMWQRAVLNRNTLAPPFRERPVFLWADEAQYFVNNYDADFQSTCRGSRACTVYLSQNLPTYYAQLGGGKEGISRVQQLLGNFATKIFHNNSCAETNEWAAKTLGRILQRRGNFSANQGRNTSFGMNYGENANQGTSSGGSTSTSAQGNSSGANWGSTRGSGESWGDNQGFGSSAGSSQGWSEQMDYMMEPAEFGRALKTGGPANRNEVSAIWYQAGRTFTASRSNALMATFKQ